MWVMLFSNMLGFIGISEGRPHLLHCHCLRNNFQRAKYLALAELQRGQPAEARISKQGVCGEEAMPVSSEPV